MRITVRSPYPERFLAALTYEVKWLVESFWTGLRCEVTVPCLITRKDGEPCTGLFEVGKLIENKKRNRPEQPCPICNEWQSIEQLLHNAPAARPSPLEELLVNSVDVMRVLRDVRRQLSAQQAQIIGRFDRLNTASKELVSKVETAYTDWVVTAAPFLKLITGTLSLVVPVASSATKLVLDDATYKGIEEQLDLGEKSLDAVLKGGGKAGAWLGRSDAPDVKRADAIQARGAVLRQLQSWLKEKDPGFGGLVRVQNKRQEFLWVHPQFEQEY